MGREERTEWDGVLDGGRKQYGKGKEGKEGTKERKMVRGGV